MTTILVILGLFVAFSVVAIAFADVPSEVNNQSQRKEPSEEQIARRKQSEAKYDENRPLTENTISFDVKGLYYRGTEEQKRASRLTLTDHLILRPEPGNIRDENAVMVLTEDEMHIGYVPAYLSREVRENLEYVSECTVLSKSDDKIPYISCETTFSGKSSFYWQRYFSSKQPAEECLQKYPEIQQNHIEIVKDIPQSGLDVWRKLHAENPDDFYVHYKFICALFTEDCFSELVELAPEFRDKYELSNNHFIQMVCNHSERMYEEQQAAELRAMYQAKYEKANALLKEKRYEEALDIFLQCLEGTYLIQNLPKNICKCYEALDQHDKCVVFCKKMIKGKWLTENTRLTLRKYIAQ